MDGGVQDGLYAAGVEKGQQKYAQMCNTKGATMQYTLVQTK
jgi:hypothetical protein